MISEWIGIVDLEARKDPERNENPYMALMSYVTLKTRRGGGLYTREAEQAFGEGKAIDWGSELYSGSYDQMCQFLDLVEATEECRSAVESMPREAVFGYVWMENIWGGAGY